MPFLALSLSLSACLPVFHLLRLNACVVRLGSCTYLCRWYATDSMVMLRQRMHLNWSHLFHLIAIQCGISLRRVVHTQVSRVHGSWSAVVGSAQALTMKNLWRTRMGRDFQLNTFQFLLINWTGTGLRGLAGQHLSHSIQLPESLSNWRYSSDK